MKADVTSKIIVVVESLLDWGPPRQTSSLH